MTDDANPEPGWYWIRSSDSDAEFPIRLREDGYWLLGGGHGLSGLPPSWSIVARIDDLLRDAARYRDMRDALYKFGNGTYATFGEPHTDKTLADSEEFDRDFDAEIAREKGP
jgi:hypothetical protein